MGFTHSNCRIAAMLKKPFERRQDKFVYHCLCSVLRSLLCITRFMGILPISCIHKKGHASACEFVNEKFWMGYSFSIQCLYASYLIVIYGIRFYVGPISNSKSEWYVMTMGYFISDFETLIAIFVGTVSSKRICENLRTISKLQGFSDEAKIYKKKLWIVLVFPLGFYSLLFLSHTHVAVLRLVEESYKFYNETYVMTMGYFISDFETLIAIFVGTVSSKRICENLRTISKLQGFSDEAKIFKKKLWFILVFSLGFYSLLFLSHTHVAVLRLVETKIQLLDSPPLVMMRSIGILYTAVEIIIVFAFCFLIILKYRYLTNMTTRVMQHLYIQSGRNSYDDSYSQFTDTILLDVTEREMVPKLQHLEEFNHHLKRIVHDFNSTMGLSILVAISSSLYTTMYYLYRFCTASEYSLTSNKRERLHYVVGLMCRSGKLLGYMFMGNQLLKNSQQPLEVIRESRIIYLPMETQQQVQTLMLQWLYSKSYLSAWGIIKVGPWLLAPIVGNVITYFLVALQFNEGNRGNNSV